MSLKNKITILTRHYYSNYNRKTTVHFIAREFEKRGFVVNFISVGRSRLSTFIKPESKGIPKDLSCDTFAEIEPNIHSIVMDELIHPISTQSKFINALTFPLMWVYGKCIPKIVIQKIEGSDLVLIECGYGVAYFNLLKTICTKAKFIYFATDPLSQVGLRKEFERVEMDSVTKFDLVRVASNLLGERFPKSTNLTVIPQGLDKTIFDQAKVSPYAKGTKNFVSIGDMSFDFDSIIAMARLMPEADFHIFGANIPIDYPNNIKLHGEVEFSQLVPFVKFADVGIMPYKMNTDMKYLTKTSLKFLQYSYCGLPIVTPVGPDWERDKVFQYEIGNQSSIKLAIDNAVNSQKDIALANGILDWGDCVERLSSQLNAVN